MPPTTASARTAHWLWPPLLLLGCVTALIAWMLIALALGHQAGWMALLVALEVAWMLRLGTLRAGSVRIGITLVATVLVIVGANWGIASAQLGGSLGLDPWTSAQKMGAGLAWTLLQLANSGFDLACYLAALVLGWWAAR
ncbi:MULTISPECIES: hypothetical protein [Xanthomonas]|uniref:Uncharacterized protein n=4 Tax=Xanthomonas hortorum TaxID=56454 RepID=A0A9X3YYX8_9XANT|nr:hypothetical protein [Xanthomonas hortorum]MBG3851845.1 hypothetical protein [Xanthomonas hortorum pv. carotae]CAD7723121.1 hypothetical protein LMG31884_35360 [Xanthomonas hydrangeae]APP79617.1 hypothetical protein BJD10_07790 [Xanthomonas hortorum pv. gardneri]KLB00494.1 membrane protein [Xanthomonas hortorum pv. gardneri]KLB00971.1 membrane protein [Xanthomonas hortorum pv. gardneri]